MENKSRMAELRDDLTLLKKGLLFMWAKRVTYIVYCSVALVVALIISFSIPKNYSTTMVLVPESYPTGVNSALMSMAGMAGINLSYLAKDAYSVDMYPMIVSSNKFLTRLGGVKVESPIDGSSITYATHLVKNTKTAWWSYPAKWFKGSTANITTVPDGAANADIRNNVICTVDKIKGVILVTVHDQYPPVCKVVADSLVEYLNDYIVDYRTKKTSVDYNAISQLADSLRGNYMAAQQRYASYVADGKNTKSPVYELQCSFLKGEQELAYAAYMQMMTQAQSARVKMLEAAPVYSIVEAATVPGAPVSPKSNLIVLVALFAGFFLATLKLLLSSLMKR